MALQPGRCPACGSTERFARPLACGNRWHEPPEEAELQAEAARQIREEADEPITDLHRWDALVQERFATLLIEKDEKA